MRKLMSATVVLLVLGTPGCQKKDGPVAPPKITAAKGSLDWASEGARLRKADQKEEAVKAYDEAIKLDPNLEVAIYNRALIYAELSRDDEAVASRAVLAERKSPFAETLQKLFAINSEANVAMGDKQSQAGDFEGALARYKVALIYDRNSAGAYIGRGLVWAQQKKYDEAIAEFDHAIKLDTKSATAYHNRAIAWGFKKDYNKALADYDEAIRLDPSDVTAHLNRGYIWESKKEFDKAIADYSDVIRLDPQGVYAYNGRGYAWRNKKEYDKAIADHSEAVKLDPNNSWAFASRGVNYYMKKSYDDSLKDFNESIRLDPKGDFARSYRGKVWFAKMEYQKAQDDFEEAIRLDPQDPRNYAFHAWMLATCPEAKYRNGKKALDAAKKAVALEKTDKAEYLETLAAAYAETGDFAEAVRVQEKVVADRQFKNDTDARSRLELYRGKKPYRQE